MGGNLSEMEDALFHDVFRCAFAGSWLCSDTDGHDELLSEFGVGWMKRKAASTMGYGVDKQRLDISVAGTTVTVKNTGGHQETNQSFTFGDTIKVDAPDGSEYVVKPEMKDGVWMMENPKLKITRAIAKDGRMVQTITTPKGTVAHRYYTK